MTESPEEDLPTVLQGLSAEESTDAFAVVSHELHKKSNVRRFVEIGSSLSVIVIIFAFVIPKITGSDYAEIWDQMAKLSTWEITALIAFWFLGMLAYTGVLTNTLPGLKHTQALTVNFAGSAVSNVMPFGGAIGVGATYAIDMSWGFTAPSVTLSILVSGIWNVFAKLAMPVLALILLIVSGNAPGKLFVPTLLGLVALVVAAVVLGLIMRSEGIAKKIGQLGQATVGWFCRLTRRKQTPDIVKIVLDFRHQSIGLVRERWLFITLWIFLFNLIQFLLLFACIRAIGIEGITLTEAFAAFAFARLLETIPITPSGVGFVEVGAASALISFGGPENASTAAIFLFRGFVYLLEIPVGAMAWVVWASMTRWRRPIGSVSRNH
ncbi:MAG: lysylphosphatidylglycerol synthase transmembrane domain-containing protein [Actinobacteria bacterium]|nr:lysylphosphatidylglycerol synthase transmembrane domain-containing protein [Actinomycetota bacterium]